MRSIKIHLALALCLLFWLGRAPQAEAAGTLAPVPGSNNQDQINQALSSGGKVHLNAGTYTISDTIVLHSGNTLEGDAGARIVLVSNANWPRNQNMIEGRSVSNVRITGFEVDGNRANNTVSDGIQTACGRYFYTMIYFLSSSGIEVDHMVLHHNWNDILKFSRSTNVTFHDNTVRQPGHDVVYAIGSDSVKVYNNFIRIYCNSGVRPDGTTNIEIYNNDIARDEGAGGYAGIEIQGESSVRICNNNIHDCKGGAVADLSGGKASISYSGCGSGNTPTGGSGGDSSGGGDDSDSGGDTDGSGDVPPEEESAPSYWYPTESLLNASPYARVNLALPAQEQDLDNLYPQLGKAPLTATEECTELEGSAGFIPCGRHLNDPATSWNECNPCNLCSLILMGQLIVEFLIKLAAVAATLALVLAGFLYVFAVGKQELISRAKSAIVSALTGFVVVFVAWAVVDSILMTLGYIDPLGGTWHAIC